jgi:hypothetical protein
MKCRITIAAAILLILLLGYWACELFKENRFLDEQAVRQRQIQEQISARSKLAVGDIEYDNHGGFAYPGKRIIFHASGTFDFHVYTDVRAGNEAPYVGTFQKDDTGYTLSGTNGQSIYRIVQHEGIEYLLEEKEFQRVGLKKDSHVLSQAMRKTVAKPI